MDRILLLSVIKTSCTRKKNNLDIWIVRRRGFAGLSNANNKLVLIPFILNFGGRERIRTPGLLVANEEKSKLRHGATTT